MKKGKSIWESQIEIPRRKPLEKDITVEAAVIGAGMTGILTAYFLQKAGIQTVVLEADRIAGGQTGRTTAKITLQHGLCYHQLIQTAGREEAAEYARANRLAIESYRKLVQELSIDCDFFDCDAYLYTQEENLLLEEEEKAAIQLGIDAHMTNKTELPFSVKKALCFPHQAAFHPLKFLARLAEELTIYEQTKATEIKDHTILTEGATVTARKIVIACHYPFTILPGVYFARMHQVRSYVAAIKGAAPVHDLYYGIDAGGYSFRQSGEYLLLGGCRHRTGENIQGGQYEQLLLAARRFYPKAQTAACWSAQDCVTIDDIPYIGQLTGDTKDIYVATGFKKWGMTHAMAAAEIIKEKILWGEASTGNVFRTNRFHGKASLPMIADDMAHTVKGLSKSFLVPEEKRKSPRCAHMGCSLVWNPEEETWDCPCHGSRFTPDGKLLDGPAKTDLEF